MEQKAGAAEGQSRSAIPLYLAANILYWVSLYLYVPTLPTVVEARTGSLAVVGIVIAMYGLWQAVARIPVGMAVDATGRRRPFLATGFLFAAAGAMVMGVGQTAFALATGRALTGFAAATWVPLVALFAGFYSPEKSVYSASVLTMTGAVGRLSAMSVGGLLSDLGGERLPFYLAAVSGLLAALVILAVPFRRGAQQQPSMKGLLAMSRSADLMIPTLLQTFASFASWAVLLSFVPVLAQRLGATDAVKGLLMSASTAASLGGNLLVTTLARRTRPLRLLPGAILLQAAGIVAAALAPSLAVLFAAAVVMGVSTGVSYPTLMGLSVARVSPAERATAMGVHQAVYAVGMFTGPWYAGAIAEAVGIRPMFALTAALVTATSVVLFLLLARRPNRAPDSRTSEPA
jgi:MFS family permease